MAVELRYTRRDGTESSVKFGSRTKEVYLGYMGISEISLKPLSKLRHIRILTLQYNHLKTIDLSPLADCTSLSEVYLRGNQFEHIDLSPFRNHRNLSSLFLNQNRLQNIDLTPLGTCNLLSKLNLRENAIESVDLTPLFSNPSIDIEMDKPLKAYTLVSKNCYSDFTSRKLLDVTTDFDIAVPINELQDVVLMHSILRDDEPT